LFETVGLVTLNMVEKILPTLERRQKAPYVIMECFQEIPCNPCYTACKFGGVEPFEDINKVPKVNYDQCTGCALCVSACPGLACYVIDETYCKTESTIKLPYEFLPLPQVDQLVEGLDRQGNTAGKVRVVKVQTNKALDHTGIVTVAVPKEQLLIVRNIRLGGAE